MSAPGRNTSDTSVLGAEQAGSVCDDVPGSTPAGTRASTTASTPENTPTNTPTNTPSSTPTGTPTSTPGNTPANTPGLAARRLRVGIVGLGIMGGAYARNVLAAGMDVVGFDTDRTRRREWLDSGGVLVESAADVVDASDFVITALSSVAAFKAVMLDDEAAGRRSRPGQLFIETGTLPLELKQAACAVQRSRGACMIDAPVTGTRLHAERRELVVYASGDPLAVERARPVIEAYARDVRYVGEFGAGLKLKLVTNLLVAIHNIATAEALALARRAGLDLATTYDLINSGPARSDVFGFRGPMMVAGDYGNATMRLDVFDKDLSIIDAFSRSVGAETPLFQAGIGVYKAALLNGDPTEDVSAVFRQLAGESAR
jgi:3-hydroxyisobutyrate dehydrogenase-like beta-hydroxyacid dehydrogenase